ncbi:MAG: Alpha/beta hydrolase fold [Noviherbaspirillum sp.]|nr:Alpha/beta hydrolase fold [Noviherbaspirillum sp.]
MEISIRGHKCVYDLVGEGPTLTLLHSVGLSTRAGWRYQIDALARHFRVLSFDFRGLGQSERGSEPLGVATFVRDLEALLQALGISRTALMGISLGGFVAQSFALDHPDLVSALVLVSTSSQSNSPQGNAKRRERNERIRTHGMAVAADVQVDSHFSKDFAAANPDIMAWYKNHYLSNDPDSYIPILEDLCYFDTSARLGAIRCPTLVVAGDADDTTVAGRGPLDSASRLHQLIPGAEFAVVSGAKHYPQIDSVDTFNARIIAFLKGALVKESAA